MLVQQIMARPVITAAPYESVLRANQRMNEMGVGGLPVVAEDGRVVGIITSRDIRRAHPNRLVADAMSRNLVAIAPAASVWEAQEMMQRHNVERLVVMEEKRLVGVITKDQVSVAVGRLTDDLTGLPTGSYLRFIAEQLLRDDREIALVFLDLDDFGVLNKRLGHAQGDTVLRQVAQVIRDACYSDVDFPCRYGGDEFAIVTTRPIAEATQFTRLLAETVAAKTGRLGVTISAGIVGGRRKSVRSGDPAGTVAKLIDQASRGSTEAKRARSRVLVLQMEGH